jgi:hypothetical protein
MRKMAEPWNPSAVSTAGSHLPSAHGEGDDLRAGRASCAGEPGDQYWLDAFEREWGERYPPTVAAWRASWEHVTPFLALPGDLRRAVYTTNTIEGLHRQVRKAIKARGHFPDEQAATKLIYLALVKADAKWQRNRAWTAARAGLKIHFGDRFPGLNINHQAAAAHTQFVGHPRPASPMPDSRPLPGNQDRSPDEPAADRADLTGAQLCPVCAGRAMLVDHRVLIPPGAQYVTARQLAHRYQVSTKWVTAHASQLGATPISDAINSELRYHLASADAFMLSRQRRDARPARKPKRKTGPRTTPSGAPVLTFR